MKSSNYKAWCYFFFTEILTSYPIHLDRASATTFSDPGIC